ncbi:hypothetical protein NRB16_29235, partial [Pseudomonas sp. LJDD11]|uniref:hypothetical protein n=1 Tax=Pseudomonas sp. LJDD11 TaxID=2931984 RepID=UPI00211BF21D
SKTIPTPCRQPSGPWSIVLDPGELPVHQLLDPILRAFLKGKNSELSSARVSLWLYVGCEIFHGL